MALFTLTTTSTLQCPHGGAVQISSLNTRVKADTSYAALENDQYPITGCPFQIPVGTGTVPSPCVEVQWSLTDTKVKVNGTFTVSFTSVGLCLNAQQVPQGPVVVSNTQQKAQSR